MFFAYKSFLGYRRGADGKPEIDPEQANTVRRIYDRFLAGDSLQQIANGLTADGIPTPMSRKVALLRKALNYIIICGIIQSEVMTNEQSFAR